MDADVTLGAQRELAGALRPVCSRKTPRGFLLRAEDFFGFTKRLSAMRSGFLARIAQLAARRPAVLSAAKDPHFRNECRSFALLGTTG